jgi:hypothetical protein
MRRPLLVFALVLVASACGPGDAETATPEAVPGVKPDVTVLRVETAGGFVPVELALATFPELVVLADGTVWAPAPQLAAYPPPAIPALQRTRLDRNELGRLLGRLARSGELFEEIDFGEPPLADLPTTTVTAWVDGEVRDLGVYAVGHEVDSPDLGSGQREARAALTSLLDDLRTVIEARDRVWRVDLPEELLAWSIPLTDHEGPASLENGGTWPDGVPQPRRTSGSSFGCTVLRGTGRDAVLAAAANADLLTVWELGDGPHRVVLRPRLVGSPGCP